MVRVLFEMARHYGPSVIFIDEIDSLCSKRGGNSEHEASRRLKTEILVQMDGISGSKGGDTSNRVVVLGATNNPWDLDNAIIRRLEKRIHVPIPDKQTRLELFNFCLKGINLDKGLNLNKMAEITEGYSSADISIVCRDASMMPMRKLIENKSNLEIKSLNKNEMEPITTNDVQISLNKTRPSVSKEEVIKYEKWTAEFGSS